MSGLRSGVACLCLALCAACAHGAGGRTVIMAGSVCSGLPPLTAASAAARDASATGDPALVAYYTAAPQAKLVVYDIRAGRPRFQVTTVLRNRPQLLDDVVVAVDDQQRLVAYDLKTGQLRAQHALPRPTWLGAVQVGQQLIFTSTSLSFRPAERGSTLTALDLRTGATLWEHSVPYPLSRPSAAAGRVFVISDHADVWAMDAASGRSVGCARIGSEPIEWLKPYGDELLVGAGSARSLSLGAQPPTEDGRLKLPIADLPGQPLLQPSGYQSVPAEHSAHGRVAVAATLEAQGHALAVRSDHYYFAFYRHLFAYSARGQLRWVHALDSDAVRLRALANGLLVVTESGEVLWLRARDGSLRGRLQLPDALTSADATATQLAVSASAQTAPAPGSLRLQLRGLALDSDARLLPSRRLAVSALADLPDPEATRDLLDVYTEPAAPEELRRQVARVLATRRTGTEFLIEALAGDYDFLSGAPAPPLAAIVPGLVTNHEVQAVPRLIDRLFDPDTRLSELNLLVDALSQLGGTQTHEALGDFFALYHADSSLREDVSSLLSAAQVLWSSASTAEVAVVDAVSKDPSTLDAVKAGLVPLMATAAPSAPSAPVAQGPEPEEDETPPAVVAERLSDAAISSTLASHASELRECVTAELARNPRLRALRFTFVIDNSGTLSRFSVWPQRDELVACLQPKLKALRFPAFARGNRLANYTISLQPQEAEPAVAEDASAERSPPFWFVAKLRGVGAPAVAERTPWWRNQNPLYVSVETPAKPTAHDRTVPPAAGKDGSSERPASPAPTAAPSGKTQPDAHTPPPESPPAATDQWWLPAQ